MTITNGLITTAEYAQFTGYAAPTGSKLTELEACIESASRMTETYSGREFHASVSGDRYFDADDPWHVRINDASVVTAVAVDNDLDGTWETTVTDYQTLPIGGISPTLGTVPYTLLRSTNGNLWPQPTLRVGLIKVTATWGWAAIPIQAKHACAVIAQDLLRDATAGFGGLAISELGIVNSRIPQRAKDILGPFQRADYVAGVA